MELPFDIKPGLDKSLDSLIDDLTNENAQCLASFQIGKIGISKLSNKQIQRIASFLDNKNTSSDGAIYAIYHLMENTSSPEELDRLLTELEKGSKDLREIQTSAVNGMKQAIVAKLDNLQATKNLEFPLPRDLTLMSKRLTTDISIKTIKRQEKTRLSRFRKNHA